MFVEEDLVLLVPRTEVLQELMSQLHDLLHADILTLACSDVTHKTHGVTMNLVYGGVGVAGYQTPGTDLLVGDLQQLQDHTVGPHVPQQSLLLLLALLA